MHWLIVVAAFAVVAVAPYMGAPPADDIAALEQPADLDDTDDA